MSTLSPAAAADIATPPWPDDVPCCCDHAWLPPADHLARRIDAAVDQLDLQSLRDSYHCRGSKPYPPALLLKVALYQTQQGHASPAAWYQAARECGPVRWLLRGCTPSRSCWYAFRDRLGPRLLELNAQTLALALAAGLTTAACGALDGTTIAANASRHRLVNQATLKQRMTQLATVIDADARAAALPAVPAWMAKTVAGRRAQQGRFQQGQQRLDQLQDRNQAKRQSKRKPAEKIVVSLSDPESVVGRDKEKVFRPLYNVQVVDDVDSPFVLAYEVFAQPNDAGLLETMLTRFRDLLGRLPQALLADTAYAGGADLAVAAAQTVTLYAPLPADAKSATRQLPKSQFPWLPAEQTYACPQGHRLHYEGASRARRSGPETIRLHCYRCPPAHCKGCPLQKRCTPCPEAGRTISRGEDEAHVEALRVRMTMPEAQALYRQRSRTVELVNADWKQHRGLRRFSGRGLARVRCQVGLTVLAHNLVSLLAQKKKALDQKTAARLPLANATEIPA